MAIVKTETYADIAELLEELDHRSLSLKAFGVLLECAMRDEDNFPAEDICYGTYLLLEQQFKMLYFLGISLREQYHDLTLSKLKIRDIDTIAAASGVSKQTVLSVLSFATGVPQIHIEQKGGAA